MKKTKEISELGEKALEKVANKENSELVKLKKENFVLKKTLEEYGIDEHSIITDVEFICINGLMDLKKLSESVGLTQDDAKTLDLLHKNLRMARGKFDKKEPKGKKTSVSDLLRVVEGNNAKKQK